jgi:TFIIE beta subunit core domain
LWKLEILFEISPEIVNYMKERHLNGAEHPLSIEEILDETNQLDIGSSTKTVRNLLLAFTESAKSFFFCVPVAVDRGSPQ